MQSLTGKRVLVTGASAGIGRATALLFANAGAAVLATGRTEVGLRTLTREAPTGAIATRAGDLTDAGHVINVSSLLARRVAPFTTIYAATKHAVAAISQGLRSELRSFNVRVTEVAPGITNTAVFRALDHPDVQAIYANHGLERLTAHQVAETIVFAAGTDTNACPDLIELRPFGQE